MPITKLEVKSESPIVSNHQFNNPSLLSLKNLPEVKEETKDPDSDIEMIDNSCIKGEFNSQKDEEMISETINQSDPEYKEETTKNEKYYEETHEQILRDYYKELNDENYQEEDSYKENSQEENEYEISKNDYEYE